MSGIRFGAGSALALLAVTVLGGCDDLRRTLGMERVSPDEQQVSSLPPLSIPPDYSLRPPMEPGGGMKAVAPLPVPTEIPDKANLPNAGAHALLPVPGDSSNAVSTPTTPGEAEPVGGAAAPATPATPAPAQGAAAAGSTQQTAAQAPATPDPAQEDPGMAERLLYHNSQPAH